MISRAHMRRQLRANGGITNARQGYGIGSWVKERVRKLIPNELASVAVKAAPFVAMLPGYGPLAAGIMRGVGRFDQRGSISDALKQGVGTYAGGKVFGKGMEAAKFRTPGGSAIDSLKELPSKFMEKGSEFLNKGIDTLNKSGTTGEILKGQLLVGGGTAIASFIASQFAEDPQQPGESYSEYMARRKPVVEKNLKIYLGQSNPGMSQEDLDKLVQQNLAEYIQESSRTNNNQGGRVGYQTGGITMANTLAQNIAQNRANQAARARELQMARARLPGYVAAEKAVAPTKAPMLPPLIDQPPPVRIQPIPIDAPTKIIQPMPPMETDFSKEINWQPGQPAPEGFKVEKMLGDEFLVPDDSQYMPPTEEESLIGGPVATLPGMTMPGGPEAEIGLAQPTYNDPLPQDQLLSGFEQFKKDNPEVMQGAGTLAIIPATLPGGYDYTFSGSLEANAFRKYLESIGQAPYQKRAQPIESIEGGLSKLAGGGRVGYDKGDMVLPMKKPQVNNPDLTYTGNNLDDLPRGLQIDTTTSNPIPDNAAELEIAEVAKIMIGPGRSGIGEPEDGTMKGYQFFRTQYLPKKIKEISENYGLSRIEILKMIRAEMMKYSKPKKEKMNKGGLMRLNYMIGGEAKQMEAGAPPIMYSGNMDPNAPNQQAGLPTVPGPMQMAPDGPEFDMRENGGFQPLGRQEGKDDVPAMLAKNEFVMTADAVRAAGGGSVQKGAQRMYDTMKKLESRVS